MGSGGFSQVPSPQCRRVHMLTAITHELVIDIGAMPILIRTDSPAFARLIEDRYGGFVTAAPRRPVFELEIELAPPGIINPDAEVRVRLDSGRWVMERGDFHAEWDPERRQGWVRQTANPYAIDAVLRILHSLILAREGGFLVHGASAVRNGRAFVFAGVSGAGKTTISGLAPSDVALLTDEISYIREVRRQESEGRRQESEGRSQKSGVRRQESEIRGSSSEARTPDSGFQITDSEFRNLKPESPGPNPESLTPDTPHPTPDTRRLTPDTRHMTPAYEAFGTPFAGELARVGENLRAPLAAIYLLAQGPENRIEPVTDSEAARALLRNILFFAQDAELVRRVFQSVLDFVGRVPVRRLVFARDARVWELIV